MTFLYNSRIGGGFDGFDTRFSQVMLLEHMPAIVLYMINHCQYIPELVVVNVGASDFMRFSNSQQWANIRQMVVTCKALTRQVVRSTDTFHGFFFNLMILLLWYIGWKCQRAVRHARSRFSGHLASMVQDHRCYIIYHDGIKATIGEGLYCHKVMRYSPNFWQEIKGYLAGTSSILPDACMMMSQYIMTS